MKMTSLSAMMLAVSTVSNAQTFVSLSDTVGSYPGTYLVGSGGEASCHIEVSEYSDNQLVVRVRQYGFWSGVLPDWLRRRRRMSRYDSKFRLTVNSKSRSCPMTVGTRRWSKGFAASQFG